jgi:hypothetical protein
MRISYASRRNNLASFVDPLPCPVSLVTYPGNNERNKPLINSCDPPASPPQARPGNNFLHCSEM